MRLIAAILLLFGLLASPAAAGQRVALVIGNGAYESVAPLANPRADAEAMAAALRDLGFEVELGVDLDLQGMRRAARSFARKLAGADVALFYYAGHGMQVYGQNYLMPVDATLKSATDLDFETFPARLVLAQMERWPAVKIVLLDACRNNPFAARLSRSMGSSRAASALSRGLAPIEAAGGMLVAYATDPGDVAADGEGRHSPFTAALLENISAPGVEINTMLARVRADVYTATNGQQRPWTETSLIGEFYMAPKAPEPPASEAAVAPQAVTPAPILDGLDPRRIELALWKAAEAEQMVADYQEYLRQYPEGIFARIAENRIAALQDSASGKAAPEIGQAGQPAGAADSRTESPDGPAVSGDGAVAAVAVVPKPEDATPAGPASPQVKDEERGTPPLQPGDAVPGTARVAVTGPEAAPGAADTPAGAGRDAGTELAALPDPREPVAAAPLPTAGAQTAAAAAEAALGLGPDERREVQVRLLLAGHDPGGIDGVLGPNTRAALSAWQEKVGLAPTGYLDSDGLARLERDTATEYAAWAQQQRREAEARQAEADRARAARRQAEEREPGIKAAGAAETDPTIGASTSEPPPEVVAEKPGPPPEGLTRDCYFVFSGSPQLERRCELVPTPLLKQIEGR